MKAAFWRFAFASSIALLLAIVVGYLAGCRTVRESTVSTAVHTDTVKNDSLQQTTAINTLVEVKQQFDSAIETPGGEADINLTPTELQPVTDAEGDKQGRDFRIDSGNTHADVDVDANGDVHFECREDSCLFVIARLTRDSIYRAQADDSLYTDRQSREADSDTTSTSVKQISPPWWKQLPYYLIAALAGAMLAKLIPFIIKVVKIGAV